MSSGTAAVGIQACGLDSKRPVCLLWADLLLQMLTVTVSILYTYVQFCTYNVTLHMLTKGRLIIC